MKISPLVIPLSLICPFSILGLNYDLIIIPFMGLFVWVATMFLAIREWKIEALKK
jgi:hypothetical protein